MFVILQEKHIIWELFFRPNTFTGYYPLFLLRLEPIFEPSPGSAIAVDSNRNRTPERIRLLQRPWKKQTISDQRSVECLSFIFPTTDIGV